ncbi:MAG: HD domain-containing protein [Roseibium sp.]|uniref:HD domain-containing protein n=1 Tax=Roseibium sp. TaxID=1936156 RepID=UPI0032976168
MERERSDQIALETSVLRHYLEGKSFFKALEAWRFAEPFHPGTRKDGETPEFYHQISMANFARTLEAGIQHPEATYAAIFLHDAVEDGDLTLKRVRDVFGEQICDAVDALSKVVNGKKRNPEAVAEAIADNAIASVVKGVDRANNQGSMLGVFSIEKQKEQIDETENFILPILKEARKNFPQQRPVYENVKHLLVREIKLFRAMHSEIEKVSEPEDSDPGMEP